MQGQKNKQKCWKNEEDVQSRFNAQENHYIYKKAVTCIEVVSKHIKKMSALQI